MPILSKIMDLIFAGSPMPEQGAPSRAKEALDRPASLAPAAVNVEEVLTKLGEKTGATDWRHSIVDLMKCFGVDATLENRVELAHELGYQGVTDSEHTAEMNMWLHKELMKNITEHGGKLKL